MVLDDVQLKLSEFLSSQASRASTKFHIFSETLKIQAGLPNEKLSNFFDKSQPLLIVFSFYNLYQLKSSR